MKKFLSLSLSDCLIFLDDGDMVIVNTEQMLDRVRQGSIFSLKNEDCKDIILIKSKENFFFTIESQRMEFYNVASFKKSDSWDYFSLLVLQGAIKIRKAVKFAFGTQMQHSRFLIF